MSKYISYNQLVQEEKRLLEQIDAIRILKKDHESDRKFLQKNDNPIEIKNNHILSESESTEYDISWVGRKKVLYCLEQLGKSKVPEVLEKLIKYEDEFRVKKAYISNILSKLYIRGEIGADKPHSKNNGYVYFTKEKATSNNVAF